jgi:hypothetical protein
MRIAFLVLLPVLAAFAEDRVTRHALTLEIPKGWEAVESDDLKLVPAGSADPDASSTIVVSSGLPRPEDLEEFTEEKYDGLRAGVKESGGKVVDKRLPAATTVAGLMGFGFAVTYEIEGKRIEMELLILDVGDAIQQVGFAALPGDSEATRAGYKALVDSIRKADVKDPGPWLYVALEKVRHRNVRTGNLEFRYYPRTRYFELAGAACRELPLGGLAGFDPARAAKEKPEACGRMETRPDGASFAWSDGRESLTWTESSDTLTDGNLVFERCFLAPQGLKLEGTWSLSSFVDTSDPATGGAGGVASDDAITFRKDGTFTAAKFVGHAATRDLPEGGFFGETGAQAASGSGAYTIRAGTLELKFKDGAVSRQTFYLFPKNAKEAVPGRIVIDGRSYLRR